jgi:hypothetical protein
MRISREASQPQVMTDQQQLDNVEYFSYFGSMVTNDNRCTLEVKSRIATARATFSSKLDLNLRKKLVKCYIQSIP